MTIRPLAEQMQRNKDVWGQPYRRSSVIDAVEDIARGLMFLVKYQKEAE